MKMSTLSLMVMRPLPIFMLSLSSVQFWYDSFVQGTHFFLAPTYMWVYLLFAFCFCLRCHWAREAVFCVDILFVEVENFGHADCFHCGAVREKQVHLCCLESVPVLRFAALEVRGFPPETARCGVEEAFHCVNIEARVAVPFDE